MHPFSLEDKVALVTGGGTGIGFGIASAYARAGAVVVFNARSEEKVEKALAEYRTAGIAAHGYVCDVTDESAVLDMVERISRELGGVDILVNNAGIVERTPMLEMETADYKRIMDINLNAPFIVSKAVLPGMIKKRKGKIINICSMLSELGRETMAGYTASKGGLKMLTKNIACEFAKYNIQCNGLGSGYIETPLTAPLRQRQPDGSRHPFDAFILARTPAERWGTVGDIEGPAVFLASSASDFVNGQILYVDGGILAYIGRQQA